MKNTFKTSKAVSDSDNIYNSYFIIGNSKDNEIRIKTTFFIADVPTIIFVTQIGETDKFIMSISKGDSPDVKIEFDTKTFVSFFDSFPIK